MELERDAGNTPREHPRFYWVDISSPYAPRPHLIVTGTTRDDAALRAAIEALGHELVCVAAPLEWREDSLSILPAQEYIEEVVSQVDGDRLPRIPDSLLTRLSVALLEEELVAQGSIPVVVRWLRGLLKRRAAIARRAEREE